MLHDGRDGAMGVFEIVVSYRDGAVTTYSRRFDLAQRGDSSNFDGLEETIAGRQVRLKRILRETHFRPRWSSGVPEGVEGFVRQYRLLD